MEIDAAIRKLIVLMHNIFGNVTIAMLTVSQQLAAHFFQNESSSKDFALYV